MGVTLLIALRMIQIASVGPYVKFTGLRGGPQGPLGPLDPQVSPRPKGCKGPTLGSHGNPLGSYGNRTWDHTGSHPGIPWESPGDPRASIYTNTNQL